MAAGQAALMAPVLPAFVNTSTVSRAGCPPCRLACKRRSAVGLAGPLGARLRAQGRAGSRAVCERQQPAGISARRCPQDVPASPAGPPAAQEQGACKKCRGRHRKKLPHAALPTCRALAAASAAHSSASFAKSMAHTGPGTRPAPTGRRQRMLAKPPRFGVLAVSAPARGTTARRRCRRNPFLLASAGRSVTCELARCRGMLTNNAHPSQALGLV